MIFSCEIRAGKMCFKVNELEEVLKEEGILKAHIDGSINVAFANISIVTRSFDQLT